MNYIKMKWRVGRKVGRTLYAMVGDEPSDDDVLIGMMDTVSAAKDAVLSHNAYLKVRKHARVLERTTVLDVEP